MFTIEGYDILALLHKGKRSTIYKGVRKRGKLPITIKVPSILPEDPDGTNGMNLEFQLARGLEHPNIIKYYTLEKTQQGPALILEDFNAICFNEVIRNESLDVKSFLNVSLQIVNGLKAIHDQNIIHNDLTPGNILINPLNFLVKICDFSISSVLGKDDCSTLPFNRPEENFAYIPPEQTGRINRSIDQRSDLYSVGALFYEMIAGKKPFDTEDPLELIHCHLAKTPAVPKNIQPQIPEFISDIIIKLLWKNPEDRYQSCRGLEYDLEQCREMKNNDDIRPFSLGKKDYFQHIRFPSRLIGREKEISFISEVFERIKSDKAEMILISGPAGIGKTALVKAVEHLVIQQNAFFISGKFDQLKNNIPYSALSEAFGMLIKHLLALANDDAAWWRQKLTKRFGKNLHVLMEIIPDLEKLVGKQSPVAKLGLLEEQNRFKMLVQNFFRVISLPEKPLVLFLDDLQWADKQTLTILELCLDDQFLKNILIIGAFRENEIDESHQLNSLLKKNDQKSSSIVKMKLGPLDIDNLLKFVVRCTNQNSVTANSLVAFLFERTKGNPFEIIEFLKWLEINKFLKLESNSGVWVWNGSGTQFLKIPLNIVDLLTKRFISLPHDVKKVLSLASCIGNKFNFHLLQITLDDPNIDLRKILSICINETLIAPDQPLSSNVKMFYENPKLEETFRFIHDKIHDAAYELISEQQKISLHSQIGQSLLNQSTNKEINQNIFEIVNHLTLSKSSITSIEKRISFAKLSIAASLKAKNSGAFVSAFSYIQNALDILGESAWENNHKLMLSLYTQGVKAAYLSGKLEIMEQWATKVNEKAEKLLDQIEVFEVLIQARIGEHKLLDALDLAFIILKKFNITFPRKPTAFHTWIAIFKTFCIMQGKSPEQLMKLPKMTHPEKIAVSGIINHASSAAYFAMPKMLPLFILRMVQLSARYGNSYFSPIGYAGLGMIIGSIFGHMNLGFRYGRVAMDLVESGNNQAIKTTVFFFFNHFIRHWKEPIHKIVPDFSKTYKSGLESGNFIYAAYCAQACSGYGLASGKKLEKLKNDIAFYSNSIDKIKQETALHLNDIFYQTVLKLFQESDNPCELSGEVYDEHKMFPVHRAAEDKTATFCLYFEKLFLCYLFNDLEKANKNALLARKSIEGVLGTFYIPLFYFYESLVLISLSSGTKGFQKIRTIKRIYSNRKKIKKWASNSPENHLHRVFLLEAESARVSGKSNAAMEKYDQAIKIANENGFIQEVALAQELTFKFYLSISKKTIAKAYLVDSLNSYERWGAKAKVLDLYEKHKNLINMFHQIPGKFLPEEKDGGKLTDSSSSSLLDIAAIVKASQAISGEVELKRFLNRMMNIILKNAGAQRGYFIIIEKEELKIEAFSDIDNSASDILHPLPMDTFRRLPLSIIRFVAKSRESVVLPSNNYNNLFEKEKHMQQKMPASILCTPIELKEKVIGVLYLENEIIEGAFTKDRISLLRILLSQAAISLENARLFKKIKQMYVNLNQEANKRKLAQEALKESKERLKTIMDSVQAGIMIIDPENFLIVDANPAALNLIGAPKSKIIHRPCYEFLCSDFNGNCPAKNLNIPESNIEEFIKTANGDKLPVLKTLTSIHLDNRVHVLESFIDIKKLKAGQNEKTKLLRQLQHSQKMEAIGTLAGGIAHDFNNILTSIIGFTELSLDDIAKESIVYENLQEVSKAGFRAKELVKQILTFARQSETEKKPVQVSSIVKESIKFLRSSLPSIIEIQHELNSDESVVAEPTQIHQILMNLCTNANHAMQNKQGILRILLNEVFLDNHFMRQHSKCKPGRFLDLSIKDTGCGISPENIERIFDPYFTTKEMGTGTGIGLSVVQGIVNSYDGIITVESKLGKGTTFHVYMPIIERSVNETSEFSNIIPSGNERILLIDDEIAIVNMSKQLIERLGYKVTTKTSSIEALQLFKHAPDAFDLVISDMTMPNMTGDKLAIELIKIRSDIPIILCTGYSETISAEMAEKIGIKALKFKPLVKQDLAISIRKALEK
jgi:PAS domain S-box-containing protein